MSWVTKMIVLRTSPWMRSSSFCSRVRVIGSSAPKGSSISITGGSAASARARPDPLTLPARELRGVPRAVVLRGQVDEVEQLVDARPDRVSLPAEQARHGGDVLRDGQVREETDLLDHVADPAAQLGLVERGHAAPVDPHVARGQLDEAVDELHRRRLAAARRADEAADLAGGNGEGQLVDGGHGCGRGIAWSRGRRRSRRLRARPSSSKAYGSGSRTGMGASRGASEVTPSAGSCAVGSRASAV